MMRRSTASNSAAGSSRIAAPFLLVAGRGKRTSWAQSSRPIATPQIGDGGFHFAAFPAVDHAEEVVGPIGQHLGRR